MGISSKATSKMENVLEKARRSISMAQCSKGSMKIICRLVAIISGRMEKNTLGMCEELSF